MRQQSVKTLKKKADALLTPLIIKKRPTCLLCGFDTQVAHHFIHRSKSNRMRYEPENLINLCASCHFKLHQNESYWAGKIIEIKGLEWFRNLERLKNETIKTDKFFYENAIESLHAEMGMV